MIKKNLDVLFDAEEIKIRIEALGEEIASNEPNDLLIVVILKGSFVFAADLIRAIQKAGIFARVDFITLSSYGDGTESAGAVRIIHDLSEDVRGQTVLLVDDILESGRTISFARNLMRDRKAKHVKTCLLLDKPGKRVLDIEADYLGFEIDDRFVVGYGLDLANQYRGLPFIGSVKDC
ncbi:MAG: hypoxanthine phosphoribosyltransferase [Rhodospirillaceae bacterium]